MAWLGATHERSDSCDSLANGRRGIGAFMTNTRHAVIVTTPQEDELHSSFLSILSFRE
jgi:hypothetical protein